MLNQLKKNKSKTNDIITPFVPPPIPEGMKANTYKGYVEYLRKKHYGETIRASQRRRWEPTEDLFKNKK